MMLEHRTAATLAAVLTSAELDAWNTLQDARKELTLAQAEIDLGVHWSQRRYCIEHAERRVRKAEIAFWTASL